MNFGGFTLSLWSLWTSLCPTKCVSIQNFYFPLSLFHSLTQKSKSVLLFSKGIRVTLTSKSAYKNPSSLWHFIVENHHFGTKNCHLFESYQPDSVKTVRMSFGTNLAETQSWLRLRNSGWETAEGWWAESRSNEPVNPERESRLLTENSRAIFFDV